VRMSRLRLARKCRNCDIIARNHQRQPNWQRARRPFLSMRVKGSRVTLLGLALLKIDHSSAWGLRHYVCGMQKKSDSRDVLSVRCPTCGVPTGVRSKLSTIRKYPASSSKAVLPIPTYARTYLQLSLVNAQVYTHLRNKLALPHRLPVLIS
jgi:endogenous inhibitor of DNA gyrase (YacG/DUF329 family)